MSKSTIIRLARYKNALNRFHALGFVKIFSDNIADAVGGTSTQVRKDFSMFGISGNKRGGYRVDELLDKLNSIFGKDKKQKVIVIGTGNIGTALINYKGYESENIQIIAAFDIDIAKCRETGPVPIYPIDRLKDYIKENDIKLAVLAVPDIAAQHVADIMISAGIKGILNFAPIRLRADGDIVINNVNLALELEKIIYFVKVADKTGDMDNADTDS